MNFRFAKWMPSWSTNDYPEMKKVIPTSVLVDLALRDIIKSLAKIVQLAAAIL